MKKLKIIIIILIYVFVNLLFIDHKIMYKNLFLLLIFPCFVFSQLEALQDFSFEFDGETRNYSVYIPPSYNGNEPVPLVFNLHGLGSNSGQQYFYGNFKPQADADNFIICLPNALENNFNQQQWNSGFGLGINDVSFFDELIDTLIKNFNIDTTKIFSAGMSNGGFMSLTLACELGHRIAKVASVTGTMTQFQMNNCTPPKGISSMFIHGTADPTVPYNGNTTLKGVEETVEFWVNLNDCDETPIFFEIPDIDPNDFSTAERYDYRNGLDGSIVAFYKINNGGHTWPGSALNIGVTNQDFNASEEIWNFFKGEEFTSIKNIEKNIGLKVFPNPTTDFVTIEINTTKISDMKVFTVTGKTIYQEKVGSSRIEINLKDYPSGIYFIEVKNETFHLVEKIIKK